MICALCKAPEPTPFPVAHSPYTAHLCARCAANLTEPAAIGTDHWRPLADTMWSEGAGTQVLAYRVLHRLRSAAPWAGELLEQLYLTDDVRATAEAGLASEDAVVHKDSNGNILEAGDSVTLIKDLKVRGTSLVAKRGAAVRNIRLVADNAGHIEGKVDGQMIVILTEFVRKR